MELDVIGILTLALVLYLLSTVIRLDGQIKSMKHTLDQISKSVDIPESPIDPEIKRLINENNDIKAIKRARELFGFTLLEGKQYIDNLKSRNE